MTLDDVQIAEAIKNNNTDMLEKVMDTYSNLLLRTSFLMLNDYKLAEDAVQETFISFYYNISRFRGEASIKTYLCRILVNECRQKMRRSWFRKVFSVDGFDDIQQTFDVRSIDDTVERLDLTQGLMKLDVKYREVLLLHYYNDLPVKEISVILGEPEGTVKSKLKRARGKLKFITQEAELFNE